MNSYESTDHNLNTNYEIFKQLEHSDELDDDKIEMSMIITDDQKLQEVTNEQCKTFIRQSSYKYKKYKIDGVYKLFLQQHNKDFIHQINKTHKATIVLTDEIIYISAQNPQLIKQEISKFFVKFEYKQVERQFKVPLRVYQKCRMVQEAVIMADAYLVVDWNKLSQNLYIVSEKKNKEKLNDLKEFIEQLYFYRLYFLSNMMTKMYSTNHQINKILNNYQVLKKIYFEKFKEQKYQEQIDNYELDHKICCSKYHNKIRHIYYIQLVCQCKDQRDNFKKKKIYDLFNSNFNKMMRQIRIIQIEIGSSCFSIQDLKTEINQYQVFLSSDSKQSTILKLVGKENDILKAIESQELRKYFASKIGVSCIVYFFRNEYLINTIDMLSEIVGRMSMNVQDMKILKLDFCYRVGLAESLKSIQEFIEIYKSRQNDIEELDLLRYI